MPRRAVAAVLLTGGAVSWMREGDANDLETTVHDLAENVVAGFPQSTFAKWWAEQQRR